MVCHLVVVEGLWLRLFRVVPRVQLSGGPDGRGWLRAHHLSLFPFSEAGARGPVTPLGTVSHTPVGEGDPDFKRPVARHR